MIVSIDKKKILIKKEKMHDCTWVIHDNDNMDSKENNDINIIVPSFIRLFVTRGVIVKYIKNNKNNKRIQQKKI